MLYVVVTQVLSQVLTEDVDVKLRDELDALESGEYGTAAAAAASGGSLRFFISSAAVDSIDSPLASPLLHSTLKAGGGLETVDVTGGPSSSSCDAVMDFTALVSPSKVSTHCCTLGISMLN